MTVTTVAGPFKTQDEAKQTAEALGNQFTPYGVHIKDAEGYTTDDCLYYVEKDDSIASSTIFGYDTKEFMARQYKT